jgi:hypothetical protein
MRSNPAIAFRVIEERDHFLQIELGFLHAGDIGEGRLGVPLDIDFGTRLTGRHQPAEALALCELPAEKYPDQVEDHDRDTPRSPGLFQIKSDSPRIG